MVVCCFIEADLIAAIAACVVWCFIGGGSCCRYCGLVRHISNASFQGLFSSVFEVSNLLRRSVLLITVIDAWLAPSSKLTIFFVSRAAIYHYCGWTPRCMTMWFPCISVVVEGRHIC